MPDTLSQQQRNQLRRHLEDRYYELRQEIRSELLRYDSQGYGDLAGLVHDPGEESVADLISDLEIAEIDRHITEIRAIEAALRRLKDGTYGICIDCEEPIAAQRLEAYPTAIRCYDCQTRHEEGQGTPAAY